MEDTHAVDSEDWEQRLKSLPQEQLFSVLYAELRRLAGRELRRNGPWLSMGPTTLLHEAFLNISGRSGLSFVDHRSFMAYAARSMRGLILDRARAVRAQRRGGELRRVTLDTDISEQVVSAEQFISIGELLDDLAEVDAELAQLVDLKFFCGLSVAEIAALRGCSNRTVIRDWGKARAMLRHMLKEFPGSAALPAAAADAEPAHWASDAVT